MKVIARMEEKEKEKEEYQSLLEDHIEEQILKGLKEYDVDLLNLQLEVSVYSSKITAKIISNTETLSWYYVVTLENGKSISQATNSTSGLRAVTREQINCLYQIYNLLSMLSYWNWNLILDPNGLYLGR